jgi:hypothetical protein
MRDSADGESLVPVTLYDDRAGKEDQLHVTPALAGLFACAHAWTAHVERGDNATLTFSSMLAAMVSGADPLCRWLRRHLALRGASLRSVARGIVVDGASLPAKPVTTTFSFRQALAEAERLAASSPLDVRHFMAAYAVIENYHVQDFLRLRIDRREWCLELAEKLQAAYPNERAQWVEYGRRAPAVPRAGFDADVPEGEDLLGIGREVEAFAMLIAGRQTATPLSIGVFGAWGSGKSYFMARLQERVANLALTGPDSSYYPHIAQVRFNAWHYGETNIIASLVDQIFRNLRFDQNDTDALLRERQMQVLAQMTAAEEVRRQAQADLEAAEGEESSRRDELTRVVREHDADVRQKQDELAAAARALDQTQAALQESIEAHGAAIEAAGRRAPAAEAAAFVSRTMLEDEELRRLSDSLARARDEVRWLGLNQGNIVWGLAVVAATLAAVFTVQWVKDTRLFAAVVGLVTAVTPVAAAWLKALKALAASGAEFQERVRARAEAAVKRIEDAGVEERTRIEEQLKRQQDVAARLQADLQALGTRTGEAARLVAEGEAKRRAAGEALAAATAQVAIKKAQLDAVTSGSLLEETITRLATRDDYRKELGTLARARTDFEALSRRMASARREHAADAAKKPPVLDRVVLYIDDLDRCAPDKVKEVLRAVHLLLAFDLFVCVVAVDPRWVIQCLADSPGLGDRTKTPELEVLGGVATPTDYLEKIFQIPLWLRPISGGQRAPIAATLLGASLEARAGEAGGTQGQAEDPDRPQRQGHAAADAPAALQPTVRAPQYVQISPAELEFLERISTLLEGNVRALKRFVNTYRLIKASLSDVELDYFMQQPGASDRRLPVLPEQTHLNNAPYMLCLTLLAVLAADRTRAEALVTHADKGPPATTLEDWIGALGQSKSAEALAADLKSVLLPQLAHVEFKDFAVWLERTRRYSFYL